MVFIKKMNQKQKLVYDRIKHEIKKIKKNKDKSKIQKILNKKVV